jgi:hypothetical protein
LATTNKSTSIVGLFDSHGGATVQYRTHCLMKEVQGFHKSPLHIAPVAARAIANKKTMYYVPTLMATLMVIVMWQFYTAYIAQ